MRRRRIARGFAMALIALLVSACTSTSKPKAPPPPAPSSSLAPRAFFWEAMAPTGARLFLLGSVHIGDGRQLVLDARIEEDWAQAQELVVELDTTSLSPIDAVDATSRFGLLPRGTSLRNVVSADTYARVKAYMKAHNYPMERIDRMRPWLVAQVVTQLEYAAAGLDAENGVDVVLMRRAAGNKGIVPLESLDEQSALFAGLPAAMQETMLVEILREAQALLAVTRATLAAWEQGDESTLSDLLFGNSNHDAALAAFYEHVFFSRNRSMADRLAALSTDGRPRFVVVGTGHLIGPEGIPELLAKRGFQVERVGSARVVPGAIAQQPITELPPPAAAPAPTATEAPRPTITLTQPPAPAATPAVQPALEPSATPAPAEPPVATPVQTTPAEPAVATPVQTTPAEPAVATPVQTIPAEPAVATPVQTTPAAAVVQETPGATPTPSTTITTTTTEPAASSPVPLAPTTPPAPARTGAHEEWLLQDAAPSADTQPMSPPIPAAVTTIAPPAPTPVPVVEPAPAAPAAPAAAEPAKPKRRRMSTKPGSS